MKRNDITQSILLEFLSYDPFTGKLWWKKRDRRWFDSDRSWNAWNARYANSEAFTNINTWGYYIGKILNMSFLKHRVIWCMCFGYWPIEIDHDDQNKLNNSLINLKNSNRCDNEKNKPLQRNNTSGKVGVYFNVNKNKYESIISSNGKRINLGTYDLIDNAIKARKQAEIKYGFHINHGKGSAK